MSNLKFPSLCIIMMIIATLFLTSCGSSKDIIYFQDADRTLNEHYDDLSDYEIKIMPGDNLLITVSALNPQAAEPFNTVNLTRGYSNNLEMQGFLVDENGDINFPVVGKLHLGGFTKSSAIQLIQNEITQYIDKPVVNIRFMNYKISVLGEVNRPGAYFIDNERVSIPEALARAGDMTIYGQRHDILVCRMENGEKKVYHVDMTSPSVFLSEVYYLQQNDIIYVQPNKSRVQSSAYSPMISTFISIAGLLVSITTLVINLLR